MSIVTSVARFIPTICILALAVLVLAGLPGQAEAQTTFVVNSEADLPDASLDGVCETVNSSECTLRAAIEEANSDVAQDTVEFNITGCPGGICTITPDSLLPIATEAIIIDATTQPGVDCATKALKVVLDGPAERRCRYIV